MMQITYVETDSPDDAKVVANLVLKYGGRVISITPTTHALSSVLLVWVKFEDESQSDNFFSNLSTSSVSGSLQEATNFGLDH